MKAKNVLKVRGIRTPRLLLWMYGFFHGKVLHTGGLDPDTNLLTSAYISGQCKRYMSACAKYLEKQEAQLAGTWTEADAVLIALEDLESRMNDVPEADRSLTGRARARAEAKKKAAEAEKLQKVQRLSQIFNTIVAETNCSESLMEATREALMSGFSAYGHGLLMKPVNMRYLPSLDYAGFVDEITARHSSTWNKMISRLQEV